MIWMGDVFYNKTVTIWNKSADGLWETEAWHPTIIRNVRLLVSRGNNIQNSGNATADSVRLHIDDSISIPAKPYVLPADWKRLSDDEKERFFTLESENDSFFVEGDVTSEDPSVQENFFEYMKMNYSNCFKISSVDRFEIIPHFEVWGR